MEQNLGSLSSEAFRDVGHGWEKFIFHEQFEKYKKDYIEGNKLIIACEVRNLNEMFNYFLLFPDVHRSNFL